MLTIFQTGEFEYPEDANLNNKPVKYDINSLLEVASRTASVNVTDEHGGEVIGKLENFIVEDGLLKANEPNNLDLKGKGFSPVFNFDGVEHEDYIEPCNIVMTEIGLTKTPRTHIVYNSIEQSPNGEGNKAMNDTEIQKLVKRNNELQEEIGVLKNQNKQLSKAIKDKDKEIKKVKDSYSDVDDKINEYDNLKDIESKYNKLISSKKDDLIHQMVGDDEEKAKRLQKFDVEDLQFQAELMKGDDNPRGLTSVDADEEGGVDRNGNIPTPSDDSEVTSDEIVEFYEENFGEKPSFLTD